MVPDRAVFTAIVYVLTTGCAWRTCRRHSGPSPNGTPAVPAVDESRVVPRLHRAVLDAHGGAGEVDWSCVIIDAASVRAKRGAR